MIPKSPSRTAAILPTLLLLLFASFALCCSATHSRREFLAESAVLIDPPKRPVILLSGFAHAKLFDPQTQRFVWGTAHSTMQTRYADNLDLPVDPINEEVIHDRLIPKGFAGYFTSWNFVYHLGRALERYGGYSMAAVSPPLSQPQRTLYRFAYDWRLSMVDNARLLDAYIEEIRDEYGNPDLKVDIVGQSLGGSLALTYIKLGTAPLERPEEWDAAARRASAKVHRVILLGAPQEGAVDAFRVLVRPERIVMRVFRPEWTSTYPALAEVLPTNGRFLVDPSGKTIDADLWNIDSWRRLQISLFDPEVKARIETNESAQSYEHRIAAFGKLLHRGTLLRQALDRPLDTGVIVDMIASDCLPTPVRVLMRPDRSFVFSREDLRENEQALVKTLFEAGDGSITIDSATRNHPEQAEIFCDEHQAMALDPNVFRAVIRSLQKN